MKALHQKTIGEIVAANYEAAEVFAAHGIDFCCNGNRELEMACNEQNVSLQHVIGDLNEIFKKTDKQSVDYNSWPLDLLADVIEQKHHAYVEDRIPVIKQFLQKLCHVHGKAHPELIEITKIFETSAGDLTAHMKKEELILFPFIRKLEAAKKEGKSVVSPQFDSVSNPVDMMMQDHETEGERFRMIHELSNGYQTPEDGCNTYQITYAMLKDFESDLHLHIHLENNILFPRSVALEKQLSSEGKSNKN